MKATTHDLFSVGLVVYLLARAGDPNPLVMVLAIVATTVTNVLIDEIGHSTADGLPRRRWVTHSVFTAPLWGVAAWVAVLGVPAAYLGDLPSGLGVLRAFAWLGVVAGWSHLLLDSLTEGGVFAIGTRRRALAHFGYDNRALNLGFSLLGLALLLEALLG